MLTMFGVACFAVLFVFSYAFYTCLCENKDTEIRPPIYDHFPLPEDDFEPVPDDDDFEPPPDGEMKPKRTPGLKGWGRRRRPEFVTISRH